LVIAPAHDGLTGPNVLVTDGAPHRVTPERLAAAKLAFAPLFADLRRPIVVVLIGGTNRNYRLAKSDAETIGEQLGTFASRHDVSLAVTPSRRTAEDVRAALTSRLAGRRAFIWDGSGENPYFGLLAHADAVVVTADSVSMTSEAAVTGKPVYVLDLQGSGGKFERFHAHMRARGITRRFTGAFEPWNYAPPDDMARAAAAIRQLLVARGLAPALAPAV
jgi:mitochondrial fission protein ELM1